MAFNESPYIVFFYPTVKHISVFLHIWVPAQLVILLTLSKFAKVS